LPLLHLLSKLRDTAEGGARIGIILNGSPLFTGGASSGESEIRRYILETDLLETIVALPTDMFYNTGIATYVWVLSNKKAEPEKDLCRQALQDPQPGQIHIHSSVPCETFHE
jgi:type I restriction enzyme M protein